MHEMIWGNRTKCRLLLAHLLEHAADAAEDPDLLLRQNRRTDLIEAALAPVRDRLNDAVYRRLCAVLALVFGPESMVVFSDVLRMDDRSARDVESWAVRVLMRAALEESSRKRPKNRSTRK